MGEAQSDVQPTSSDHLCMHTSLELHDQTLSSAASLQPQLSSVIWSARHNLTNSVEG